ncbi:MAG: hypothetical protein HQK49_04415 [Oligoflexia bacterium]|nr:hypothetical protein [Oligoflexia bacterium]
MKKISKRFIDLFFSERLGHFINQQIEKIEEINRKYATPKVTLTPTKKWILLFLRFYVLFLLAILFYKFCTII